MLMIEGTEGKKGLVRTCDGVGDTLLRLARRVTREQHQHRRIALPPISCCWFSQYDGSRRLTAPKSCIR